MINETYLTPEAMEAQNFRRFKSFSKSCSPYPWPLPTAPKHNNLNCMNVHVSGAQFLVLSFPSKKFNLFLRKRVCKHFGRKTKVFRFSLRFSYVALNDKVQLFIMMPFLLLWITQHKLCTHITMVSLPKASPSVISVYIRRYSKAVHRTT